MNNVFTIQSIWESDAKGFAIIAGRAAGLNEEQIKDLIDHMDDGLRHTAREIARDEYYDFIENNK